MLIVRILYKHQLYYSGISLWSVKVTRLRSAADALTVGFLRTCVDPALLLPFLNQLLYSVNFSSISTLENLLIV